MDEKQRTIGNYTLIVYEGLLSVDYRSITDVIIFDVTMCLFQDTANYRDHTEYRNEMRILDSIFGRIRNYENEDILYFDNRPTKFSIFSKNQEFIDHLYDSFEKRMVLAKLEVA
jgi:hypothetical protein